MESQATDLSGKLEQALSTLHEAYEYALDTRSDTWDFAVPIRRLRMIGLNESDLRWLVRKELVKHAQEVTVLGDNGRAFRSTGDLTFTRGTCFVLTETGITKVCSTGNHSENGGSGNGSFCPPRGNGQAMQSQLPAHNSIVAQHPKIEWEPDARKLHVNGKLAKRFKWPAVNQEALLNAFQEESWPPRIDDPLPPQTDQDPKRRLADTIKCLNRKQTNHLIHFRGDGTGEGVVWELVEPNSRVNGAE